jgi:mono/diheme cytochrome c family protein
MAIHGPIARLSVSLALVGGVVLLWPRAAAAGGPAGEVLYRRYCAACHGVDGRGNGPVASALSPRPTDLTSLDSSESDLMREIDGRRTIRAHGPAAMPVWGEIFEQSLIGEPFKQRTTLITVHAIAQYVHDLHQPPRK